MNSGYLSSQDILTLLASGMSRGLHWFPEEVTPSRLANVLVGMANGGGGTVLLGIAPRLSQIVGVKDTTAAIDRVFQASLLIDPILIMPIPQVCNIAGTQVLAITVPAGLPHVYSLEGRFLGRDGSQTSPLPARQLRRLLVERGLVQFETLVAPDSSLEDLDWEQVESYLRRLGLPVEEDARELLLRRGGLRREKEVSSDRRILKPTHAGILLFGRDPQRWVPSATILAARFSGTTFSDRFIKHEISGTLPDQLHEAEAFVRENQNTTVRLVGLTRQETSEYPMEAVRELLVNAVAHRDYNLRGDSIHLNLFSDRLEIHSPGGLPGPVTLENLLEARFSRNAILVQVLSDMGYVEKLGYGLDRVVTVMRESGLPRPHFEETAGTFRVTLTGESVKLQPSRLYQLAGFQNLELNARQQSALVHLTANRRITNRDYQELCPEVHPETLRRDLADLVSRGLLIKVGDKKSTYYILK